MALRQFRPLLLLASRFLFRELKLENGGIVGVEGEDESVIRLRQRMRLLKIVIGGCNRFDLARGIFGCLDDEAELGRLEARDKQFGIAVFKRPREQANVVRKLSAN